MRGRLRFTAAVLACLAGAAFLAAHVFLAQGQKPVRERPFHVDGGPGIPATLDGLFQRSAAVIEGVVETEKAIDEKSSVPGIEPLPHTMFGVRVTSVFRSQPRPLLAQDLITVRLFGAKRDRGDHYDVVYDPDFPLLKVGARYILFLNWDVIQEAFVVPVRSAGVYRIVGNAVQSDGRSSPLSRAIARLSASEVESELARLGGAR